MGLNVCVYRQSAAGRVEEHPEWDWFRHEGDRLLPRLMSVQKDVGTSMDPELWARPEDPGSMREALIRAHPENADRWRQLESILADPDWWLYFSV